MATTIVPPFDGPLDPRLSMENLRGIVREWLAETQGDCDKAGDVNDAEYYQGWVDATTAVLEVITGKDR